MHLEPVPRARFMAFDYEPVAPFRVNISPSVLRRSIGLLHLHQTLEEAVNELVVYGIPASTPGVAVVQDGNGTVIVGYIEEPNYVGGVRWYGVATGYAALSQHPLISIEDAALWEMQAQGELDDVMRSS